MASHITVLKGELKEYKKKFEQYRQGDQLSPSLLEVPDVCVLTVCLLYIVLATHICDLICCNSYTCWDLHSGKDAISQ